MGLLQIENLSVEFGTAGGGFKAVDRLSLEANPGDLLAIVGESGSGKSVSALSILQLLPYPTARHPSGSIRFRGREIVGANEDVLREVRGDQIGMIFQEPLSSLNPLHDVEKQIGETLELHKGLTQAQARALSELDVAIPHSHPLNDQARTALEVANRCLRNVRASAHEGSVTLEIKLR